MTVLATESDTFCNFASVLIADFVPLTFKNTKRYARLVVENVRNFRKQDGIRVRAFSVDCYYCIFLQGILTTLN
jgi:hypothetical protein